MYLDATGCYFKLTQEEIRTITRMTREGYNPQCIANAMNLARKTIIYHLYGTGLYKRRQIQNRSLFILFHQPRDKSSDNKAKRQVSRITNRMLDSLSEQELFNLYRITAYNHTLRNSFARKGKTYDYSV